MSDSKTHNDERRSDLAVLEANEYKQRRRLERILDALDGVEDTADEAWNAYVTGDISREAYNIALQRAVKKAIRECSKLLTNHYQEAKESGATRDRYWMGDHEDPLGSVEILDEQVAVIIGLKDFMEAPTFFETTETETVEVRNRPDRTVTRTVETTMPERLSYRAYIQLKEFLDDVHDMEISFEEMDDSLPNWGFEREEEVPDDAVVL